MGDTYARIVDAWLALSRLAPHAPDETPRRIPDTPDARAALAAYRNAYRTHFGIDPLINGEEFTSHADNRNERNRNHERPR